METDLVLNLTIAGITLGIVEGIKPGPLLTVVIKETLAGGFKAGMRAASAPIFTDGPLILVSVILAGWIATQPMMLFIISLIGALFLTRMGIECFSLDPPTRDYDESELPESFKRGILTNLLNPNVYAFWFLVGGPLMASSVNKEPLAPFSYAIAFLVTIVLVKMTIAYFFSKTKGNISVSKYRLSLKLCGLAMLIFAMSFVYKAMTLWQAGL